jgi:hypothetical protein
MNIKLKKSAVSVAILFLAQSAFACDYPERIADLPDGNSATRDEMVSGKKIVQSYIANMESYLSCIEAEEAQAVIAMEDADDGAKAQREQTFKKKYNAAVDEMNLVAEEFNIQLRAYNARNKK